MYISYKKLEEYDLVYGDENEFRKNFFEGKF